MMKTTTFCTLILSFALAFQDIQAQQKPYYLSDSLKFVDNSSQVLPKALSGGYHCPQFSNCDLNGDLKKDLVIYDKLDGSVSTYINKGSSGEVKYELDNRYAAYFPKMRSNGWMLLRDFNRDGYEDIFTIGSQGYTVFKNISYTVSGRPAFIELPLLNYRNFSADGALIEYNVMSTPSIHLPGIYDIDFDGDLDIMSYSNIGGAITLYMNYQEELNLPADSMRYFMVDLCWGYFNDNNCNNYILNTCSDSSLRKYRKRHTNGSSITLFDANDDGDIDMLLGNEGCTHMTMLYNVKNAHSRAYDSFYMYDTNYVTPGNRADVTIYPAAYFLDIDNDGKRDLVYAPNSTNFQYYIEEKDQIFWFKNTGTDLAPVWAQQQALFTPEFIDNGNKSNWACADWDKDGDLDCIAASNGNAFISKDTADRIYLYENVGNAKNASMKLINSNFANMFQQRIKNLTVSISDMDNDGKLDLVCGNDKGEILFFRNTSSQNNTLNPSFTKANSTFPGFNIDIGGFSAPTIADINKDGLKDLVIGRGDSMLSYYRNSGTLTVPDFTIVTNKFGNMKPIDSIGFQYIYDDTMGIIGYYPVYEKFVYSKPQVSDLDGDGTLEIVIGNSLGSLRMYEINSSSPTSTFKQIDSFHFLKAFQGQKFYNTDLGSYISPCLADLNGDTVPEILIAGNRGGLQYLKNGFKYKRDVSIFEPEYVNINGYPNPANKSIEFNLSAEQVKQVEVYNSLGQLIPVSHTSQGQIIILNTENLGSGFYIIQIRTQNQKVYTSKFQILKNY
jgi:hypothetical protein